MAEHDAGQRFHFQVVHGVFLLLREIAHLGLREFDILEVALAHLRDGALDLGRRQAEILRRPVVEFLRQVGDRGVLARVDVGENVLHRFAHLGVGGLDRTRVHSALEPTGHGYSSIHTAVVPAKAGTQHLRPQSKGWMPACAGMTVSVCYFIACGLIGLPVPPVMISGGPQKKNS